MGTASGEQVFKNFIDVVKNSSTIMGKLIAIAAPWAVLCTYISQSNLARWLYYSAKDRIQCSVYASVTIPGTHPLHSRVLERPSRELKAVTLENGVKEMLVDEVSRYLHPSTKRYYAARGIPWRRGYLFYGPPGTGKSSFVMALAGHFRLDVYMLSLSSTPLNDDKLMTLFELLPRRCIVLLEDIDSAHVPRGDDRSHPP